MNSSNNVMGSTAKNNIGAGNITISAIITRADGTVENKGIIFMSRPTLWFKFKCKLKKLFKRG